MPDDPLVDMLAELIQGANLFELNQALNVYLWYCGHPRDSKQFANVLKLRELVRGLQHL